MATPQNRLGQQMGEYRLLRLLGKGAFGAVYLAEHVHDGSWAAVKLLYVQLTHAEEFKAFLNEARTIRLRHPHIVPLLDFGLSDEDQPFLVMEYAAGGTLRERHARGSRLTLPIILSYVQQVASALQYAHERRVIHRDVKPENMLLRADGRLLLSDFGISTVAHSSHSINLQEGIGGTLPYMAPEQIQGKPRPASDQYALAIVVYEWIAGQRPFQGTAVEMAMQHAMTPPPSLLELVPTLARGVEQVVLKALAKEPKERFASIEQFAQALQVAAEPPSVSASPIASAAPMSQDATVLPTPADMLVETVSTPEQSQQHSRLPDTPLPQSGTAQLASASSQTDQAETLIAPGMLTRASSLKSPTPSPTGTAWAPQPPYTPPAQSGSAKRSTLAPGTPPGRISIRAILIGMLVGLLILTSGIGLWTVGAQLQVQHNQQATATAHTARFATVVVSEFPIPTGKSSPYGITAGPDGNLWFVEGTGNKIGRLSPGGTVTEFSVPTADSRPVEIIAGPGGNLWFTEMSGSKIGRIKPDGTITEFSLPTANSAPDGITVGPDGNLWFAEGTLPSKIGRLSLNGAITEFLVSTTRSAPHEIRAGPDGNLWFTDDFANKIGRISTGGVLTEFPVPTSQGFPSGITVGPDGNLWFTEYFGDKIGRISPGGTIAEFSIPTADSRPVGITSGPDGNLWFTEGSPKSNKIGRISPGGTITEFSVPTANSAPDGITVGPDGNLWFTEFAGNKIGRAVFGK